MSTNADEMMDNLGLRQQYASPPPAAAAPGGVDPEKGAQDIDLHAYGLAMKQGDTESAAHLHGDIMARQQRMSARAFNPTNEMGTGQRFAAGMGRGMTSVANTLLNPQQQDIREGEAGLVDPKTDKPLLDTTSGSLGNAAGQVAATLPVGGVGGGLTKALLASKLGGNVLGRVGARAAVAGGENAASNALSGEDAGEGAAFGAGASALTGAGGRLIKGLVKKSPAADRLYQDAAEEGRDLFIPISQGGTGLAKSGYQNVLPYALGVEGRLEKQSKQAGDVISEVAAEHGMAPQVNSSGGLTKTRAPIGDTMEQTAQDMRSTYDKAYQDTVKGYAFKPMENFHGNVVDNLANSGLPNAHRQAIASKLDQVLDEHTENGVLTGENLLRAKAAGREALTGLKSPAGFTIGNKSSTEKAMSSFDDIIQDAIDEHKSMGDTPGASSVVRDLENYKRLAPAYSAGNAVASTAEGNIANRGELKFGKLAENAPENSPLRSLAQDAHEVLEKESPGGVNPAGRHAAAVAGTVLPTAAIFGHLPAALGVLGGANVMATKGFQKGLYGDTAAQQALADALRRNPNATHLAGYAARQGTLDASR